MNGPRSRGEQVSNRRDTQDADAGTGIKDAHLPLAATGRVKQTAHERRHLNSREELTPLPLLARVGGHRAGGGGISYSLEKVHQLDVP